jgi:LacI family transcriptional regulator
MVTKMESEPNPFSRARQLSEPLATVRRVTMNDVAAASGVSRATVSLVVRDSPQIPNETKERVHGAMEQLGYVYDHRAAAMRASRTMTVGLVVTDVRNPYFAELTMALEIELQQDGYALLLGYTHDDRRREDRLLEVMVQRHVDGVLLIPSKDISSADLERRLVATGTPHVLIARRVPDHQADYVGVDNESAGMLLGEHLALVCVERVAFLGGPPNSSARAERQSGLAAGLLRNGISMEPALSIATSADRAGGIRAVQQLLATDNQTDAIVCYSDVVAFGVMSGLRAAGLEPGRDVALASFDDIPDAELQHPPLTSVATYPERVGAEAARLLTERLDSPALAPRDVLLSPQLAVRASSTTFRGRSARPQVEPA